MIGAEQMGRCSGASQVDLVEVLMPRLNRKPIIKPNKKFDHPISIMCAHIATPRPPYVRSARAAPRPHALLEQE